MHMRESRINPILLLVGIILSTLILNVVSLGEPFSTLPSEFEETEKEHDVPVSTNAHWGPSYKRPYPTNAWFQNVVLPGFGPLTTYPYIQWISPETKYFGLCYPNRVVSNMYVMSGYMNNLMVSANEALGDRQLVGHDDLSALVQFASVADATKKIVSPIVRGQAYNTFEFTGLTPKITTIQMYTSINGLKGQTTVTADKLKITMNNGQTWLIYSTSPITWNVGQSALVASAPFTGVIRIAHLLDPSYETVFDRYRATYPYSGSVSYSVASGTPNDIATLTFRFTKKGGNDPLLLFTLPHHRDTLTNANYVTPTVTYRSIKGDVILNIGDTWTLREPLVNDIGFYARYTINEKDRETLRAALIADQNSLPGPKDPYFGGKAVARLGRLAVIADELGETAIAAKIRSNMKAYLNKWFNVGFTTRDNKLIYEKTYGGIVSKNSISCSACDFGQYYYNDHHFHYGYFVYAAAVVIKKDQAWGATYKNKILELARDYGNPSNNDPYYAKLRNKDWFVGHSFAAGLYAFADSRNQESTSESINAYYGLYLLGLVYNDQNMKDIGRITLATEIRSAQKYWQINSTSTIYEPVYSANRCVGVLWETKVDYATFFGLNVEYIHGIQMLPYTPITIDYITPDWIKDSYPVFSAAYTRADPVASDAWKGLLYQAQAVIDLPTATSLINTLKGYDDGNTRTNTLYWLYTIPSSYNQKRTNVFADIDPVGSTPSPAPSPTPTPSPSPTPTPTPPTPTPSPNPSPSPTPNPPSSGCTISCGPNTEVCGGACISSDKFSCCSGTAVTKGTTCGGTGVVDPACTNVKCAAGYNCCGGACYNPSIFSCFDGMLCAVGYNRCGKSCYDPKIFSCCSGALRAGSC